MTSVNSRTLTVVLSESDWRALRELEPDAVGWLRERIRERIGSGTASDPREQPQTQSAAARSPWDEDQY